MCISPGGPLGVLCDVFVADIQSAKEADSPIDEQDLAMVALAWPEAPKPLRGGVELDDAGTGAFETGQRPSIESV